MTFDYDILVIGAGSAGLSVSLFMGKAGLRTLLVDRSEESLGGDCLNYGCVPSKALIHVTRILKHAKDAAAFGYTVSGNVDVGKVMGYVHGAQETIRKHENSTFLRSQGIDVVLGEARFQGPRSVSVNGKVYSARNIVIATGSRPQRPAIPGIEKIITLDNESLFRVADLPSRMLVLGGGPVGVEIAQSLRRLGREVTLVERNKYLLPRDPIEIADRLQQRLQAEGIIIYTGCHVAKFNGERECVMRTHDGAEERIEFDSVFLATGRTPNIENLDLQRGGIRTDKKGIISDDSLRTTNPNVFVCGDIAGRHMLSHAAEQHARVLLNNFFSPVRKRISDREMSWVTFTDPEVATFGMSEPTLHKKGISYERIVYDFGKDDRAVTDDYTFGKLVLFVSTRVIMRNQVLLGGSMIAPNAGEMVQELILVMNQSLDIDTLFNKLYPYPVSSRVNQLAIVSQKEKQLTPAITRLLRFLYRTFR